MKITAVEELGGVAKMVLEKLGECQDGSRASVLALHGDLGAGKTTFMQRLAKELGVAERVTSPTFVIMKGYGLEGQKYENLVHIDAYRIEDVDEMRPLGFATLLAQKDTIVCIEWAEKIAELLPEHTLHMTIEIEGRGRSIEFK